MVITKVDLAPLLDVDLGLLVDNARRINPALIVFPVAARQGHGIGEWCSWLRAQVEVRHAR
jgi:hydrogenase nickel incorporation protein HypB